MNGSFFIYSHLISNFSFPSCLTIYFYFTFLSVIILFLDLSTTPFPSPTPPLPAFNQPVHCAQAGHRVSVVLILLPRPFYFCSLRFCGGMLCRLIGWLLCSKHIALVRAWSLDLIDGSPTVGCSPELSLKMIGNVVTYVHLVNAVK